MHPDVLRKRGEPSLIAAGITFKKPRVGFGSRTGVFWSLLRRPQMDPLAEVANMGSQKIGRTACDPLPRFAHTAK